MYIAFRMFPNIGAGTPTWRRKMDRDLDRTIVPPESQPATDTQGLVLYRLVNIMKMNSHLF